MKISLHWLREYVDYDGTPDELAQLLTMAGVEVEGIETRGANIDKVVVAQVLSREQHPNADRLSVCRVEDGTHADPPRQIVCGATNFKVGDKVPLALPGAVLPGDVTIQVGKLRGVESEGMLCSARELRLAEDSAGLLILPESAPVGAPIGDLFPTDTIFDLEITPNRPDLLSHVGLAREVAALTGKALRNPVDSIETPVGGDPAAHLPVLVAANARDACPYYSARLLDGIKVGPSPDWLRSRLEAVGARSINNVVDVTNFVMLELGQPLHAFDAAHIGDAGLGVRLANAGEELLALDGRTYKLQPHHLVIARMDGQAEGLAGIMGGEESGVTARTTSLVLESAFFAPAGIRRTARELGLSSDASYRFERGVNPAGVMAASRRAEDLLLEIGGGTSRGVAQTHLLPGQMDELTPEVSLRLERVRQVLGTEIDGARVEEILAGFGLEKIDEDASDETTTWRIPAHRTDLRREIDLVEEVARVYGLEEVPSRSQATFAPASSVDAEYDFLMELRRTLVGLGFAEARRCFAGQRRPDVRGGENQESADRGRCGAPPESFARIVGRSRPQRAARFGRPAAVRDRARVPGGHPGGRTRTVVAGAGDDRRSPTGRLATRRRGSCRGPPRFARSNRKAAGDDHLGSGAFWERRVCVAGIARRKRPGERVSRPALTDTGQRTRVSGGRAHGSFANCGATQVWRDGACVRSVGALPQRHARPRPCRGPVGGQRRDRGGAARRKRTAAVVGGAFRRVLPTTAAKRSPWTKSRSLIR